MAKITLSELKKGQMKQLVNDLNELRREGQDNRDVFETFLDDFKEFIGKSWAQKGRPFGKHWVGLSTKYKEWKLFNYNDGAADLILTGALRDAATGGSGWFQKVEKARATWGIDKTVIPYASVHQYGFKGIPQRPYIATVEEDLPGPMQQRLLDLVRKKIELTKAFKGAK